MSGVIELPANALQQRLGGDIVYGNGSDGDVTITTNTSLSRDMFYNNLTILDGVVLNPNGWRIFVKGTLAGPATGQGRIGGKFTTSGSVKAGITASNLGEGVTNSLGGNSGNKTATQATKFPRHNLKAVIAARQMDAALGQLVWITGGASGGKGADSAAGAPGTGATAGGAGAAGSLGYQPVGAPGYGGNPGTPGTNGAGGAARSGGNGGAGGGIVVVAAKTITGNLLIEADGEAALPGQAGLPGAAGTAGVAGTKAPDRYDPAYSYQAYAEGYTYQYYAPATQNGPYQGYQPGYTYSYDCSYSGGDSHKGYYYVYQTCQGYSPAYYYQYYTYYPGGNVPAYQPPYYYTVNVPAAFHSGGAGGAAGLAGSPGAASQPGTTGFSGGGGVVFLVTNNTPPASLTLRAAKGAGSQGTATDGSIVTLVKGAV